MTEIRAAFIRLRRSPGFVIGATLSLAIGMSLGTAVFSIAEAILTRQLPFGEPDRVGRFYTRPPQLDLRTPYGGAKLVAAMRAEATAFSSVAAADYRYGTIMLGDERSSFNGQAVTPNYFETMQARPYLGRLFRTGDVSSSLDVVVSHEFWVTKLAADSTAIGRGLLVNSGADGSKAFHVLGVLPPGFDLDGRALWFVLDEASLTRVAGEYLDAGSYAVISRLAPQATLMDANRQVEALFARVYKDDTRFVGRLGRMESMREFIMEGFRQSLQLWTAAAVLILLLCAVNFAAMSLARGMKRRAEIAVRAALGASRMDIVRELVTEALLLASISGVMTILLGWWLVSVAVQLIGPAMPFHPGITWSVVAFGFGATLVVGFIFAVAPAAELSKVDLRTVLQGAAAATTARGAAMRGQRLLVALQLSLALMAVATVAALIESDEKIYGNYSTFNYDQLVFVDAYSSDTGAHLLGTPALEQLSLTPGVGQIAVASGGGTAWVWDQTGALVKNPWPWMISASPNLFDVIGVHLVAGRLPTDAEMSAENAYVVSTAFARSVAGSVQAAVGLRLKVKPRAGTKSVRDWATIVGVVPDVGGMYRWSISAPIYSLRPQNPHRQAQYILSVAGDPLVRARDVARSMRNLGPSVQVNSQSATAMMDAWTGQTRGRHMFLIGFASLGLLLAIVGVYGMTSYTTELRLREFGIRRALGADTRRLAQVMFADLWWMTPIAVGLAVLAAGRMTAYMDAMYRNPMAEHPLVKLHLAPTVVVAATLVLITIVGTSLPLRRVMRLDLMRTVQGSG